MGNADAMATGSSALFDPQAILESRVRGAMVRAVPDLASQSPETIDPMVTASRNAKFGDYQCNAAMGLGKKLGKPPREIAQAIVKNLDLNDIAEPITEANIAGPGFINITLKPQALSSLLTTMAGASMGFPAPGSMGTAVVDLCGVNLAKQMHVGHLRSTVIGDTLANILQRAGWKVIRQNHVGDWGLPIAMVTSRLIDQASAGLIDLSKVTLDDLDKAYKAAQRECESDQRGLTMAQRWHMGPKILAELQAQADGAAEKSERARSVLRRLQTHDKDVMAVWQRISDVTMSACLTIAARLNADVRPEHSAGESSYAEELAPMVAELESRKVAEPSEGALVIRLEDVGLNEPLLIRKSDGAFLYATTDMAAIRRRVQKLGAQRVVYCVDARQSLHFKQVFAGAAKAGYAKLPSGQSAVLEHAAFGTILGEDGRPFKTRSGESAKLGELLDQAEAYAFEVITQRSPEMNEDERRSISRTIAVAAIRYVDLSTERIKDYVFSYQRMVSFEGNTGPYLLYALVRIRSIFRKAAERGFATDNLPAPTIAHAAEKTLALTLLRYPGVVQDVAKSLEPSRLCAYLYELAGVFSTFFDVCPVLSAASDSERASRLALCKLAEGVLADGLKLLGIPTLEKM
jgi:arginyl-tRNA synthetase